jgi:rSAM/selenodomain-associated transferase 1
MASVQIAVLARAAVAGAAKTRLIPLLGAEGAAALQAALTAQALRRAHATGLPALLWVAGTPDDALRRQAAALQLAIRPQPSGDLGDRMLAAVSHAHAAGAACLVIGTDCPAQTPADLLQAAALLGTHDVVLQPAHDGGYVLIGMRQPVPQLFAQMPWGGDTVCAQTVSACRRLGLRVAQLRPLPDLDRPDDLAQAIASGAVERTVVASGPVASGPAP